MNHYTRVLLAMDEDALNDNVPSFEKFTHRENELPSEAELEARFDYERAVSAEDVAADNWLWLCEAAERTIIYGMTKDDLRAIGRFFNKQVRGTKYEEAFRYWVGYAAHELKLKAAGYSA